jgi:uncharacterized protein
MALDWNSEELAAGLACYRGQEFFDAHEHWEAAWNRLTDPEKSFLQGLIQLTVAMHHYQSRNRAGASSLLKRAQGRFARCADGFGGVDVRHLANDVSDCLRALDSGASLLAFPAIQLMADHGKNEDTA